MLLRPKRPNFLRFILNFLCCIFHFSYDFLRCNLERDIKFTRMKNCADRREATAAYCRDALSTLTLQGFLSWRLVYTNFFKSICLEVQDKILSFLFHSAWIKATSKVLSKRLHDFSKWCWNCNFGSCWKLTMWQKKVILQFCRPSTYSCCFLSGNRDVVADCGPLVTSSAVLWEDGS